MLVDSQEKMTQTSVEDKNENLAFPDDLTPNQVKVGAKTIMTYAERLAFLRSSKLGQLYGIKQEEKSVD